MVHDQLSQGFDETVDFDTIAQRGLNAVVEVSANGAPVADGARRARSGACAPRTRRRWP